MRLTERLGTRKVKGKLESFERKTSRYDLSVCGLGDTYWRGNQHFLNDTHSVYFWEIDHSNSNGVASLLLNNWRRCVIGYKSITYRMISIKPKITSLYLNIKRSYAPTSSGNDRIIESFYTKNENAIKKAPKKSLNYLTISLKLDQISIRLVVVQVFWTRTTVRFSTTPIDYILIGSRWKITIRNGHTFSRADCESDHQLLRHN